MVPFINLIDSYKVYLWSQATSYDILSYEMLLLFPCLGQLISYNLGVFSSF